MSRCRELVEKYQEMIDFAQRRLDEMGISKKEARRRLLESNLIKHVLLHIIMLVHVEKSETENHWLHEVETARSKFSDWNVGPKGKIGNYTKLMITKSFDELLNTDTDLKRRVKEVNKHLKYNKIKDIDTDKVWPLLKLFATCAIDNKNFKEAYKKL